MNRSAPGPLRLAPDSLLGRAFLLIGALLIVSVLASFQLYRLYEREPRSRELAQQTVSIINLTRAALINADPDRRQPLILDLNEREGLRLAPALPGERLQPLPGDPLFTRIAGRVRGQLGERTRFAYARDGVEGFWVSFFIDDDEFWAMLPRERVEPTFGLAWFGWGALLIILALIGAWMIASRISRPLAALTHAAGQLGRGEPHEPLAESGSRELRSVAAAFNRMAGDLGAIERERAMVLAGISHDLRTPLARLRLSLEVLGGDPAVTDGMVTDIEEIDAVIGQFLDYARGEDEPRLACDLDGLANEVIAPYRQRGVTIAFQEGDAGTAVLARTALRRALVNLINNALRHGKDPVEIRTSGDAGAVAIDVLDRGTGIPADAIEQLKRPFTRLDDARGGGGSGLGLAIVDRIARQHGGSLELLPRTGGGLCARLNLPRG